MSRRSNNRKARAVQQAKQHTEKMSHSEEKSYASEPGKQSPEQHRVSELETQLKQALSDYHILKRDMEKRLQFEGDMVRAGVLRSIIGIADDIDMALSHKESADVNAWREGMVLILHKMQSVVEQTGAKRIECNSGDVFDPRFHEAVGIIHEGKDGTIAQIVQNGYALGDTVVRPVRVIVNKPG